MSLSLGQIVLRVGDPGTPVVWLDPSVPDSAWAGLPASLHRAGYSVIDLDGPTPVVDLNTLLERFAAGTPPTPFAAVDLASLRQNLLRLANDSPMGWVVLFRAPELLRQNDEATFEELLELLAFVHDSRYEIHQRVFKLIVRD
ncbi:hypothetical protein [uncultured Paludibaculum sp.]|uniref:hypothetical protein n=1 Tax=uncultured Paludibaculum sp. TaxID=1765020 RepID=UPI002AABFAFA|nr:hypothetical protein [uncultured Paludibaculum sp.]